MATKPWHNSPECPRGCGRFLVGYGYDQETPVPDGKLRCTACGMLAAVTPEEYAQAQAADAAWWAEEDRVLRRPGEQDQVELMRAREVSGQEVLFAV